MKLTKNFKKLLLFVLVLFVFSTFNTAQCMNLEYVRTLGEGGQAIVALVEDTDDPNRQTYVCKIFKQNHPFNCEYNSLVALHSNNNNQNNNIIQYLDYGLAYSTDEHHMIKKYNCILTKYIPGLNLSHYNNLDDNSILSIMREIFIGLQYIHSNGIVHGDLKPNNIMISLQGQLKIIDFGSATPNNTDIRNFYPTGTYNYMAPESFKVPYTNFKTDMWSAGCILYELCNQGKKLLIAEGNSQDEHRESIKKQLLKFNPNEDLKSINNHSQRIQRLIQNLLVIDPNQRISATDALRIINEQ